MIKVVAIGRLTGEWVLHTSEKGVSARNQIASKRPFKAKDGSYKTDFVGLTAFGASATRYEQLFHKGDTVVVTGNGEQNEYEKDGIKHIPFTIVVQEINFVGGQTQSGKPAETNKNFGDAPVSDEPDLPF